MARITILVMFFISIFLYADVYAEVSPLDLEAEGIPALTRVAITTLGSRPTCEKRNFTIFRRDKVSKEIYLNHCRCENCGQLFIYNVDKKNNPVLGKGIEKDDA